MALPPPPTPVRMHKHERPLPAAEVLSMWDLWNYVKPLDLILLVSGTAVGIPLVIFYLIARRRKAKKKGKAKSKE
jgi:hypothetical protein